MPIDRYAWPATFTEDRPLKWSCGGCGGTFVLDGDDLRGRETGPSKGDHKHPAWDPEWIRGRFTAEYACASCGDLATMIGTYVLHEDPESFHTQRIEFYALYRISAIDPAPHLIGLPAEVPEAILDQLQKAFRLFWVDRAACANALRGVVELFLNHRRVRKTSGSGRRRDRLPLHARIQAYTKSDEHLGSALMAAKWIGNVGSHSETPSRETLFDALDLIEHVLKESFASDRTRVAKIARRVNRRKGRG